MAPDSAGRRGDNPGAMIRTETVPRLDGPHLTVTLSLEVQAAVPPVSCTLIFNEIINSAISRIPTLIITRSVGKCRAGWAQIHAFSLRHCKETRGNAKPRILREPTGSVSSRNVSNYPLSINLIFFTKY